MNLSHIQEEKARLGLVVLSNESPRREVYEGRLGRQRTFQRKFRVLTRDPSYESKLDREARELAEALYNFYWALVSLYGYNAKPLVQLPLDSSDEVLRRAAARNMRLLGLNLKWEEVRDLRALRYTISRITN